MTPLSQRVTLRPSSDRMPTMSARISDGAQAHAALPSSVSSRVTVSPIRKPSRLSQADSSTGNSQPATVMVSAAVTLGLAAEI